MGSCSSSNQVDTVSEPGDAAAEVENVYSATGAKSFAQRVDNGEKFLEGLIKFLQTRAEIEANYAKRLSEWKSTWDGNLEKQIGTNPQIVEAFRGLTAEAEAQSRIHQDVNGRLNINIDAVNTWRQKNYTKKGLLSSGTKEGEEIQHMLEAAQKPWAEATQKARILRDEYHRLCKEEIQAEAKALGETANNSKDSKKVKDLEKALADKRLQKSAKKLEYETELATLPQKFPEMEEELRQVMTKIQLLEKQRLTYVKAIWVNYLQSVDMSDNTALTQCYSQAKKMVEEADLANDIENAAGKSMETKPAIPKFEEFSP